MANKKLDDCYFYYYSTCYKGDGCAFRHEENALGCETVCSNWKTGNCQNVHCPYRHMLLKKNRKTIPCYWESQPNGCRKPHCPFMHSKGKPEGSSQDTPNVSGSTKPSPGVMPKNIAVDSMHEGLRRPNPSTLENDLNFASPPVDPLVVKFEEESDNELDIPSPCKSVAVQSQNKSWVKTLEEIRLEKIQELSAAFYSFTEGIEVQNPNQEPGNVMMDVLNKAIVKDLGVLTKTTNRTLVKSTVKRKSSEDGDSLGFRVLTLAEIRQKRQKKNQVQEPDSTSETEEKVTADVLSDDMRIEESSSQSRISGASSAVVHRVINIGKPLESSATSGFQGKNPSDIQSPEESSDIDVSHSEIQNIIGCQKLSQENVTKSTNLNVPQKGMSSKISFQESISPQKVDQCEDASKKLKEINVVNPLQQSTKVADNDASQIQKLGSVNVTKPLLQDVCLQNQNVDVTSWSQQNVEAASKNQQNPDLLSRSQQSVDVPSRNEQNVDVLSKNQQNVDGPSKNLQIVDTPSSVQQVVDTPPKNKPIRLKRNMRLNTQEEQDQGAADSAKRPRTNEASFSLNSSQSDELDQSNLSNPGEMDTDDILNGIDELLGN